MHEDGQLHAIITRNVNEINEMLSCVKSYALKILRSTVLFMHSPAHRVIYCSALLGGTVGVVCPTPSLVHVSSINPTTNYEWCSDS